jgi:hypothetical protein
MPALSAQDILRIWEAGTGQEPVGRPLTILAVASPAIPRHELAALTVGRRDARLLAVLEETFGSKLESVAACAQCGEPMEFVLEADELRARLAPGGGDDGRGSEVCAPVEGEVCVGDWSLRYRLPTSSDLVAAGASHDPNEARRVLSARCIVEARRAGALASVEDVPPEAVSRMADAMAEQDPMAEVLVDFACPACGERGETIFDVAAYLWEQIRAQALRLLQEVDVLARAYGWREADILALSAARRHAYLDLAT